MYSRTPVLLALAAILAVSACVDAPLDVPDTLAPAVDTRALSIRAEGLPFSEELAHLGDLIFDDRDLSISRNQGCNACHSADWGFTGPDAAVNAGSGVYEGSIPGRFGDRKPPSSAYSTPSPVFHFTRQGGGMFVGGNFYYGRATGARLGNPAVEQAQGPFLNPVEQGLRDAACVVFRVREASYGELYRELWGDDIETIDFPADIDALCGVEGPPLAIDPANRALIQQEYDNIAVSIAVYEESHNLFSSKFDAARRGMYAFTKQERQGRALFQGKGRCSSCHTTGGQAPLFTNFSYANLGVPKNPANPVYAHDPGFVDRGLGAFLLSTDWAAFAEEEFGKMKVPTLRNVDLRPSPSDTKAFMHNGVFKSLEEVVHFYNTRDVLPECAPSAPRSAWGDTCWPAPEFEHNVDTTLGDLGLSADEEAAIVAFLRTLSDGYLAGTEGRHLRGTR